MNTITKEEETEGVQIAEILTAKICYKIFD